MSLKLLGVYKPSIWYFTHLCPALSFTPTPDVPFMVSKHLTVSQYSSRYTEVHCDAQGDSPEVLILCSLSNQQAFLCW